MTESGAQKKIWEVGLPPQGPAYEEVLEWIQKVAQFASVICPDDSPTDPTFTRALRMFIGVGSEIITVDRRPGELPLDDETVRQCITPITPELIAFIGDISSGFREWDGYRLPMSLHFLRADRSVLLGNSAWHNDVWLDLFPRELSALPRHLAGLLDLHEPDPLLLGHPDAAWKSKGDQIVLAKVDGSDLREQLWCRRLASDRFEVCCIPFHVQGLALGDEVYAERDESGNLMMTQVAQSHGHGVELVYLIDPHYGLVELIAQIRVGGGLVEKFGRRWVAVDKAMDVDETDPLEVQLDRLRCEGHIEVGSL